MSVLKVAENSVESVDLLIVGSLYRHFKGGTYRLQHVLVLEDDNSQEVVIYEREDGSAGPFARSLASWCEKVVPWHLGHGTSLVPRFRLVNPEEEAADLADLTRFMHALTLEDLVSFVKQLQIYETLDAYNYKEPLLNAWLERIMGRDLLSTAIAVMRSREAK